MKKINNKITRYQYMSIIQGSMIGVGILSLPSSVTSIAKQSGWISTLLCGIYPLFITLAACLIYKNMNYLNFSELNRNLFGKIISYIFEFAFFTYFLIFGAFVLSGFANVLTFSTTRFLSPYVIVSVTICLVYLTINDGLTNLGRISEVIVPLTLFILIVPLYFINKGSLTNVLPLISDYKSIFKAMTETFFAYSGVEISILILPLIHQRNNLKLFSVIGSLTTTFMYTIIVFLVIYYCGYMLTSKLQYPLLYLVAAADLPVLSSFEPLFIFLWGSKIFQTISIGTFGASYTISNLFKISYNKCCVLCCILTLIISYFLIPEYKRASLIEISLPYMLLFVVFWCILSLIMSRIKRGV